MDTENQTETPLEDDPGFYCPMPWNPAPVITSLWDEIADRGRFDEEGGELSDEDWNDVRHRPLPGFRLGDQLYPS